MTASAFSRSSGLSIGQSSRLSQSRLSIGTLIWINPLRSPMSIFPKSPQGDLGKCEAGNQE